MTAGAARPRRVPSRTNVAYARLKARIVAGELHPHQRIDAARLSLEFGLGRTPVREALLRLQAEGIVEIMPKRGVRIVTLSAEDLTEIYQVISALEIAALRLLVEQPAAPADLAGLDAAVANMAAAAAVGDREAWALADEAFHRGILEANPNRRLRDAGIAQRDLAQRAHFAALRLLEADERRRSAERHGALIQAIRAGDADAAVALHGGQRQRGGDMLVAVLRRHGLAHL